ncbi:hypothetical protein SEEC0006_04033, partial [Salmonella enterica subsp. enterica serovar Choleraesuis str. 0006]
GKMKVSLVLVHAQDH